MTVCKYRCELCQLHSKKVSAHKVVVASTWERADQPVVACVLSVVHP